jgi:hypothetical protein
VYFTSISRANDREIEKQLKAGILHIVCPASNGLTLFNVYACVLGDLTQEEGNELCDKVNETQTALTSFPRERVTALPLHRTWEQYIVDRSRKFGDEALIKRNLCECLELHLTQIKTPQILFALDHTNVFNIELTLQLLDELLKSQYSNFGYKVTYQVGG